MIQVEVRLFGKFKKYETGQPRVLIQLQESSTVENVKTALSTYFLEKNSSFSDQQLIEDSAIANEKNILSSGDRILQPCTLAILPPVCGG